MIQNLPPKQRYQTAPGCCDIEGFFGNFRPSTEARDWWPAQQVRGVNNPQFRSYETGLEESRRAIKRTMSGEKSEPTDQHGGIFECIQREGESNRDWIRRHLRGVHAYRQKMETEWEPTPQQRVHAYRQKMEAEWNRTPQPKAAPMAVSSGHQPDDEDLDNGPMATVKQGHVKQSTCNERDYNPQASPQKGSPREHDPDIKSSGVGDDKIGKEQTQLPLATDGAEPSHNRHDKLDAGESSGNESSENTQAHDKELDEETSLLKCNIMLDDNDNQVERSVLVHGKSGSLILRSALLAGHVYEEEIKPPTVNTQEGSDDDQSVTWTDDSSVISIPPSTTMATMTVREEDITNVMTIRSIISPEMTMTPRAQSLT